jgi:hypothetical protein
MEPQVKYAALAILSAALGAGAMHYCDAVIVADVLRSDDMSITRNVQQANALLDIYEQGKTKDQIKRNDAGQEEDVVTLRRGVRLAAWIDEHMAVSR